MLLHELPADILSQILDGETSWTSIELWKTGCPYMRSKLTKSAIRNVDLMSNNYNERCVWPKCLKEFKLTSLSLSCRKWFSLLDGADSDLCQEISQLHKGLKCLSLNFLGLRNQFFGSNDEETKTPSEIDLDAPPTSKRPMLEPPSDSAHKIRLDLRSTHPELEYLQLVDEEEEGHPDKGSDAYHEEFPEGEPVRPTIPLKGRLLSSLPASLTALHLDGDYELWEGANWEQLLPNLAHFSAPFPSHLLKSYPSSRGISHI